MSLNGGSVAASSTSRAARFLNLSSSVPLHARTSHEHLTVGRLQQDVAHEKPLHSSAGALCDWGRQAQGTVLGLNERGPITTGGLSSCISKAVFENVKMKTIRGHVQQHVHEAHHLGPPPVLRGSFSQLPEDDDGCNGSS